MVLDAKPAKYELHDNSKRRRAFMLELIRYLLIASLTIDVRVG